MLAYHRTDGAFRHAGPNSTTKTGHVVIHARENTSSNPRGAVDGDGEPLRPYPRTRPEFDDTCDFGRVAATTARR